MGSHGIKDKVDADPRFGLEPSGGPRDDILSVEAGEDLSMILRWRDDAPEDLRVALALVSPVEPRDGLPDVLAVAEAAASEAESMFLSLPPDIAGGLYPVRLDISRDGELLEARAPTGRRLGSVYLGPLRVRGAEP